jgi:hypothetical protein
LGERLRKIAPRLSSSAREGGKLAAEALKPSSNRPFKLFKSEESSGSLPLSENAFLNALV